MCFTAFTYEGKIDLRTHPEFDGVHGTMLITIGGWKSVADLAALVTRSVRRHVANAPCFTGGSPQRYDVFSNDSLTASQRLLNTEPDTLRLYGPVTLLMTRRPVDTPVKEPQSFRSRFDRGDFDFERLQRLIEHHSGAEEHAAADREPDAANRS